MDIKIDYDGNYPNLCSGDLIVTIDGKEWKFPKYCMVSGGSVWFDNDWGEHVTRGPWSIDKWPEDFPYEFKNKVIDAINDEIHHGCCGGCV